MLAGWLARLLAYSFWFAQLAYYDLLCLVDCEAHAVEHQKLNQTTPRRRLVEFLVFNLLALVWLELARLVLYLAYLLACLLTLLCLLCVRYLVCLTWADCAWLARSRSLLCLLGPNLTWLVVYSCGLACAA